MKRSVQEHSYGHDLAEYFDAFVWHYQFRVLQPLAEHLGIQPQQIFIGGCGFGKDVVAAARAFPKAKITAVSIDDTPTQDVRTEVKSRLLFCEQTVSDFLQRRRNKPQFDLALFFNMLSNDLTTPSFTRLAKAMKQGAYVLETDDSGNRVKFSILQNLGFEQVEIPAQIYETLLRGSLWKKVK